MALKIDLEAARPTDSLNLSEPPRIHNADNNRSDRDPETALPVMQNSAIRQRPQQVPASRTEEQNGESSTTSPVDLTPTSSETSEDIQEKPRQLSWGAAALLQLRRISTFTASSHSNKEDLKCFNRNFGYDQIVDDKVVKQYPRGFPRMAAFQSSDDEFMIFRGFKRLYCRELEQLEVQLTLLEEKLDKLDKKDDADDSMRYRLGMTHEEGWDTTQEELHAKIRASLKEYSELLLSNSQIQSLGRPPQRNHRSFFDWVYGYQELSPGYMNFIFHENDFVSGGCRSEANSGQGKGNYFDESIRTYFSRNRHSFWKRFVRSEPLEINPDEPTIERYSSAKLSVPSKTILVSLTVGVLLIPIYLLFLVNMTRWEMALTVSTFLLLFCVVLSSMTDAKTQEVLIGTAAYGAVLATFLGNLNNNNQSNSL